MHVAIKSRMCGFIDRLCAGHRKSCQPPLKNVSFSALLLLDAMLGQSLTQAAIALLTKLLEIKKSVGQKAIILNRAIIIICRDVRVRESRHARGRALSLCLATFSDVRKFARTHSFRICRSVLRMRTIMNRPMLLYD